MATASPGGCGGQPGGGLPEAQVDLQDNVELRHPLNCAWTIWYDGPGKPGAHSTAELWQSNVKKVDTFASVEDFWCLFNNLVQPSRLAVGSNFHLFKEGVLPAWEDPANEKGGKWVVELQARDVDQLNKIWLYTVLALIGEAFRDAGEICGCVVSIRKRANRLALWTKTADSEDVQRRIGKQFKDIAELNRQAKINYTWHETEKAKGRGYEA